MSGLVKMTAVTHPFKVERQDLKLPEGLTIEQMLIIAQPDQRNLENALVFVRGEVIPRDYWPRYKPKAGVLVEVRAFPIPAGGGDSGKNILRVVLMIAVMAFAFYAGPLLAANLFPNMVLGSVAFKGLAAVATAAISFGGMLLLNAVVPARTPKIPGLSRTPGITDSPALFIQGARNQVRPFSPVPVILGKYRHFPSYGAQPVTEIIGDKQFVRMLFVWGVGPLAIDLSTLKIGETLLSEFEGFQIEHREGYETDEPLTLFTETVSTEDFSILLSEAVGWVTRTSATDADELSVDFVFPQGLVEYDANGNRVARTVNVEIQYQEVGDSGWSKIDASGSLFQTTASSGWLNKTGDLIDSISFSQNRNAAIRHGFRWGVGTRGQYNIRFRRTTPDSASSQIFDTIALSAIRTITNEDPINSPVPVAKTALVIQATDQLNNIIDVFNGVVTSVAPDWDAGTETWIVRATQNPASLFRLALQGNGISSPLADERIDLTALQDWHEFCTEKGYKFNMIRDFQSSVWETLADIASAGRAAPTQKDGMWSVVVEREREHPVSLITPRNSFDFKAQKIFIEPPHAFRIDFPNENEGYELDVRPVYRDGFNESNSTKFESLELPGVTDPEQIYKLGRWRLAQGLLQPERWSFKQDMEYLTYRRGDRIAITHDVLLVGLASGRIKDLILSGANVVAVVVDETIELESGKVYGIAIRTLSDAKITRQVQNVAGPTNILTLSTPILGVGSPAYPAVEIGNLFGFGILGVETEDASVISITPDNNFRAQITAIPYREAVFHADTEEIPEFDTKITPLNSIPAPVIRAVVSDESVMAIGPGDSLRVRIGIDFNPLDTQAFGEDYQLKIQMRRSGTGEPFFAPIIDSQEINHIFISGVSTGETVDIRMRFSVPGRLPGPWSYISNYQIVGKSSPPAPLSNMTISVFGGQALIRWDKPTELDVLFGGEVVFRHSQEMVSPSWSDSVTIGQAARARTLFAVLPLKSGSYLARVFDIAGNASEEVTFVSTKQASVHEFALVDSLDEATVFLGTKTGVVVDSGTLRIDDAGSPPTTLQGTYNFVQGMDLGSVKRVRLTTRIAMAVYNVNSFIDSRLDKIDDWPDFDASLAAGADVRVFVRHTDNDPGSSPVSWSAWERLDSAEFEARAFELKAELTRESIDYNLAISELGVDAEEIV